MLVLHASTFAVGLLTTATYAAFLVISLPVGVWVDRLRRRPIMIAADIGRGLTLASVPIAASFGDLTMTQIYIVGLIQGVGTVFFDVAYMSYLPGLVGRGHLVDANAKMQASQSVAQASGPTVSGVLASLFTAPIAIVADAVSYGISVVSLLAIREGEPAPTATKSSNIRREMWEGLRFVARQPILRMIAGATATANLFISAFFAISTVFLVRQIGLSPAVIGLLGSVGAVGGILGALAATPLRRRIGSARIIWISMTVMAPFGLLIPLAQPGVGLVPYVVGLFVISIGSAVYNVNQAAFRQLLAPAELLGRVNATVRFVVWATLPLGGLLGGALGGAIGNRDAIWVAAIGTLLAPVWLIASPLRHLRDTPE